MKTVSVCNGPGFCGWNDLYGCRPEVIEDPGERHELGPEATPFPKVRLVRRSEWCHPREGRNGTLSLKRLGRLVDREVRYQAPEPGS